MQPTYPYYLANRPQSPNHDLEVLSKTDGSVLTRVTKADAQAVDRAIAAAAETFEEFRRWPAFRRKGVLLHLASRIDERRDEIARVLALEAGKPITLAKGEVDRSLDTIRTAAEEAVRLNGEFQALDISPRGEGCQGIVRRFAIGPCGFISPFNFPLNLVAHKVAPALAVGCPFVLKPSSRTPVCAILVGEILAETDLPEGAFSVLPCSRDAAEAITTDERLKLLSFTGSAEAGWELKAKAGKKQVVLELGGNAACIVDEDADADHAAERLCYGAFYQAGQSCISVQRIIAHERIADALAERLVEHARQVKVGDPLDEEAVVGPLISEDDAKRVESWVDEAVRAGASVLVGGERDGRFYAPTILTDVDARAKVSDEEVFGPVAVLHRASSFDEALAMTNDTRFGLQAGVFTKNIHHAFRAFERIEAGGVIINDIPSVRVDPMPYGGVKDSGQGREGVRSAMEHMTEPRIMVLKNVGVGE